MARHESRVLGVLARAVVKVRWFVVPLWIAAAVASVAYLPNLSETVGDSFEAFLPEDAEAIDAQLAELEEFGFPLIARVAVVQRDPDGLAPEEQAAAVARAARVSVERPAELENLLGALPIPNALEVFPGSRESGTTVVTFLYFHPDAGLFQAEEVAQEYAAGLTDVVGVTGALPARAAQGEAIEDNLWKVEWATVALVALVMGLLFRSLAAPALTLVTALIAYVVSTRVIGWAGSEFDLSVPTELEPIMVVMLIGVVTDYAIFYFSAFRRDLRTGKEPLDAARHAATTITPVVVVAGVTVAVGTAALLVAELELFQRLGPGLAVTVAVAALVASTFVPAAMAWLGRGVFWPRGIEVVEAERREPGWRRRLARVGVNRAVALVVLAVGVGGLVYVSLPIGDADVGANLIEDVPTGHEVERAAEAAATGFVPGIVAPGEVLVSAPGIGRDGAALDRLGSLIGEEPGIAAVLGPGRLPAGEDPGLFVSPEGNVARYAVFLADPPYSADAIDRMEALRERLPGLVEAAGFPDAEVAVAGDTMLAQEIVSTAEDDLIRIAIATVVIDLLLLALFLRSLVIPVVLLALSALGVLVAVATTSWVFTTFLGYDGLTFYVPFAVAVLLVAFGSDYNIFVVARIWSEARHRDLREAIVEGGSQAGSAIAAAGTVLAASFAMLALVPIGAFRQFALGMAVGVLVDTFFIRTVLLPAAIALLGRWSAWPGRDLEPAEVVSQPTEEPVPPAVRV